MELSTNGQGPMDEATLNAVCETNRLEVFGLYNKFKDIWKERWRLHQEEGAPCPTLQDLYQLKLSECDELMEMAKQQKRLLRWRNGEQVEPEAHQASSILVANFGAG